MLVRSLSSSNLVVPKLEFRGKRVTELEVQLIVASVQEAIDRGLVGEGPNGSRNRIQTPVLLDAVEKYRFRALFGGTNDPSCGAGTTASI
jgi:hypothetical protein